MSKEDFEKKASEMGDALKDHAAKDDQTRVEQRETFLKIFEKLEKQGEVLSRIDATMTFMRERR